MPQASTVSEVEEGDLIQFDVLREIVNVVSSSDPGSFTLKGSFLDYTIDEYGDILQFEAEGDQIRYSIDISWPDEFDEGKEATERSRLQDAFLRAGIARHPNLDEVMTQLRQYDDVIIGIDTNIILDCLSTSILLDEIYKEDYPNWILLAVPTLVMSEIENGANRKITSKEHPRAGWPSYGGRVGQRALQELMDIRRKDPDRPGLAMMAVGDNDDDVGIGDDNWKLDSKIREDFREFLSDINFHKGTYFMSQDRVMVMMSGSEGAHGLYLQKPDLDEFTTGTISVEECAQLIYEICIQFGDVRLESDEGRRALEIDIFWPGKHVSDWEESKMKVAEIQR